VRRNWLCSGPAGAGRIGEKPTQRERLGQRPCGHTQFMLRERPRGAGSGSFDFYPKQVHHSDGGTMSQEPRKSPDAGTPRYGSNLSTRLLLRVPQPLLPKPPRDVKSKL
jgi:hypothetical protein